MGRSLLLTFNLIRTQEVQFTLIHRTHATMICYGLRKYKRLDTSDRDDAYDWRSIFTLTPQCLGSLPRSDRAAARGAKYTPIQRWSIGDRVLRPAQVVVLPVRVKYMQTLIHGQRINV